MKTSLVAVALAVFAVCGTSADAQTLVADYTFGNAGNLAQDSSGNGYDGSLSSPAPTQSFGTYGGSAVTVSGGSYAVSGDLTPSFGSTTPVTISTWFDATVGGNGGVIVDELGQPTPGVNWHDSQIEMETNGSLNMSVWNYGGVISSPVLSPGWHEAVLTYNGTTATGYVDGQEVGSVSFARQTPFNNGGARAVLCIRCGGCGDESRQWARICRPNWRVADLQRSPES